MLIVVSLCFFFLFFFQAEDGIRDVAVTGVQTCALPILLHVQRLGEALGCVRREPDPLRPRQLEHRRGAEAAVQMEIGRASCRERSVDLGGRRIIKKKKSKKRRRRVNIKEKGEGWY